MQDRRGRARLTDVRRRRCKRAALAARLYSDRTPEILFHPQRFGCMGILPATTRRAPMRLSRFASHGSYDAVWFGRGGDGSCRVVDRSCPGCGSRPGRKRTWGIAMRRCVAVLYRAGFIAVAHGPVAQDIRRDGGTRRLRGALAWLIDRAPELARTGGRWCEKDRGVQHDGVEPSTRHAARTGPRRSRAHAGGSRGGAVSH